MNASRVRDTVLRNTDFLVNQGQQLMDGELESSIAVAWAVAISIHDL